ncbi:putative protein BREAKING OF ASYMMETRY IN THE STOMATAL LINEAGE [Helianthus annuus]|nr:uncharacterized protein LOC110872210 [Helianthus annuus]XP_035832355.1 uncharacterized protein LOC110872210 [Helianthus annuus]XP_035832356.1 uncharacterized protein LOC110872210 [Helianthus annuus]XP_035832357.1 uncharacterized protein LOC110872210 [Helianthus annuus]XP_035832358.1 uncharacterized protein LOC110872210 [Helianthus annuus]KAJ0552499.1 putative protein BREAKING OF ASYMMETRY IN THE STOMATAL LINEAGE [Helianthus annuus]KAJ0896627.1 putative protein BREAKING OF ASYMMETRY IN THE 
MKESPRRYTNPFLSDEENEKLNLWTQELEHSNIEHDTLTTLGPSDFCEKETELYTDKNVTECEFPELLICYKEGAFHVKDICVDEGIPHGERFLFDENNNEMLHPEKLRFTTMEDYYMESNLCSGTDVKVDTPLPVLEPSNDHMNIGDNRDEVDAALALNGPISDHRNMGKISIDMEIPVHDLQDPVPDYKECGYKEEVSDFVGPNESKEISKDDINDGNGISKSFADGFMVSSDSVTASKATDNDGPDISVQLDENMIYSSDNLLDNVSTEKVVSNSGISSEQDQSVTVSKATENDGKDISVQPDEKMNFSSHNLLDNVSTNKVVSNSGISLEQDRSVTVSKAAEIDDPGIAVQPDEKITYSSDNLLEDVSTEKVVLNSGPSLEQDRILPSLKSLLESIDQQPCQSPIEEISKRPDESGNAVEGNDTLHLNSIKPATGSEHVHNMENLEHPELSIVPNGAPKLQDSGSDNVAMVNQLHRGEGESSFSVAAPVPEHITYSGPIAFSGSTSLRSDSSTTSTRSFAFPILQNEWNSSPVRMAKADRRRLQKHRGWKHGLLCCRF